MHKADQLVQAGPDTDSWPVPAILEPSSRTAEQRVWISRLMLDD